MIYIFTGTHNQYDPTRHDEVITERLRNCTDGEVFVTGAAFGVDTTVAYNAWGLYPEAKHIIVVPAQWHHRDFVNWANVVQKGFEIVRMPDGSSYRERNEQMVSYGAGKDAQLIAFPKGKLAPRSGTSMTVNIARRRLVPVEIVELP